MQVSVCGCRCRWRSGVGSMVGPCTRRGLGYRPLLAGAPGPGLLVGYGHLWALWSYTSTSITCLGTFLLLSASINIQPFPFLIGPRDIIDPVSEW